MFLDHFQVFYPVVDYSGQIDHTIALFF